MSTAIVSDYLRSDASTNDSDADYRIATSLFSNALHINDEQPLRTRCSRVNNATEPKLPAKYPQRQSLRFGNFHLLDKLAALGKTPTPAQLKTALLQTQREAEKEAFVPGQTDPRYRLVPVNVFALIVNQELEAGSPDLTLSSNPPAHAGHADAGGVNCGAYVFSGGGVPRARRRFVRVGIDAANARMEIRLRPPLHHATRFGTPSNTPLWTPNSRQVVPQTFGSADKVLHFPMPPQLAKVLGNPHLRAAAWDVAAVNQHVNDCLAVWAAKVYDNMPKQTGDARQTQVVAPKLDLQLDTSYWRLRLTFKARYSFVLSGCSGATKGPLHAPVTDFVVASTFSARPLPRLGLDSRVFLTAAGNLVHQDTAGAGQGYPSIYTLTGRWADHDDTTQQPKPLSKLFETSAKSLKDLLGESPVLRPVASSPDVQVMLPPAICGGTSKYINDLSLIPSRGADTMALPAGAVPAHYMIHDIDSSHTATLFVAPAPVPDANLADAFLENAARSTACLLACGDRPFSTKRPFVLTGGGGPEWATLFPGPQGKLYSTAYQIQTMQENSTNAKTVLENKLTNSTNPVSKLPRHLVSSTSDNQPQTVFAVLMSLNLRFTLFLQIGKRNAASGTGCIPDLPECLVGSTRPGASVCGVCVRQDWSLLSWRLAQNYFYHPNALPLFESTSPYEQFAEGQTGIKSGDPSKRARAQRMITAHTDYCSSYGTYISDPPNDDPQGQKNRPPMGCVTFVPKYDAYKISVVGKYVDPACQLYATNIEDQCSNNETVGLPGLKTALHKPRALAQIVSNVRDDVLYGAGPNYKNSRADLFIPKKTASTNFKAYFDSLGNVRNAFCEDALYVNNNKSGSVVHRDQTLDFCKDIKKDKEQRNFVTLPQALSNNVKNATKVTMQICSSVTDLEGSTVGGDVSPGCQNVVDNIPDAITTAIDNSASGGAVGGGTSGNSGGNSGTVAGIESSSGNSGGNSGGNSSGNSSGNSGGNSGTVVSGSGGSSDAGGIPIVPVIFGSIGGVILIIIVIVIALRFARKND